MTPTTDAPYVIEGEWRDQEWIAAHDKLAHMQPMSPHERWLMQIAPLPRMHPFGAEAWCVCIKVGGLPRRLIFPSQEVFDEWASRSLN